MSRYNSQVSLENSIYRPIVRSRTIACAILREAHYISYLNHITWAQHSFRVDLLTIRSISKTVVKCLTAGLRAPLSLLKLVVQTGFASSVVSPLTSVATFAPVVHDHDTFRLKFSQGTAAVHIIHELENLQCIYSETGFWPKLLQIYLHDHCSNSHQLLTVLKQHTICNPYLLIGQLLVVFIHVSRSILLIDMSWPYHALPPHDTATPKLCLQPSYSWRICILYMPPLMYLLYSS